MLVNYIYIHANVTVAVCLLARLHVLPNPLNSKVTHALSICSEFSRNNMQSPLKATRMMSLRCICEYVSFCIYCRMTLGAVASVILALGGAAVFSSVHKIEEGHVGVYYRSVF